MQTRTRLVAIALFVVAFSLTPHPARAADQAKVEQLLTVLKIDRQMDQMKAMLAKSFAAGIADGARKKGLSQAEIDRGMPIMIAAMTKAINEAFSWDYMKPQFLKIYGDELSNDEINAAVTYYGSPQGQSLLAKMPILMQRGSEIGIARARAMEPRMEAIMDDAIKQIRAQELKVAGTATDSAVKQVHDDAAKDAAAVGQQPANNKAGKSDTQSATQDPQH